MEENLLSPSNLILFGRVFPLTYDPASIPVTKSHNNHLQQQLKQPDAKFARIYAMSYEGHFYNLPRPTIFLVHGDGEEIRGSGLANRGGGANVRPTTTDSGLVAREFDFEYGGAVGPNDSPSLRYWEYDKDDISLRLDITTGHLSEILIDATIAPDLDDGIASRAVYNTRAVALTRAVFSSRDELSARHRLKG